jgi:hypothetical protein
MLICSMSVNILTFFQMGLYFVYFIVIVKRFNFTLTFNPCLFSGLLTQSS